MTLSRYEVVHDYWPDYFERAVWQDDGVPVSLLAAATAVHQPGRGSGSTAAFTAWGNDDEINEVYQTDNTIDTVTSTDAADTVEIEVYGHTIDGSGNFTEVVQLLTLTGQTAATLDTPLARVHLVHNHSATPLVGTLYVHQAGALTAGKPDVTADIHCVVPLGFQQSFKGALTVAQDKYLAITSVTVSVTKKTAGTAEFGLEIRAKGQVFHGEDTFTAASPGGSFQSDELPYLIVPANADVRIRAIADGPNTPVSVAIHGMQANILS